MEDKLTKEEGKMLYDFLYIKNAHKRLVDC